MKQFALVALMALMSQTTEVSAVTLRVNIMGQ